MKCGTQLNALGLADRKQALELAAKLGCDGLEVGLGVADALREGTTTLPDLVREAKLVRDDFVEAGMEIISLTPGLLLKHVQCPDSVKGVCEVAGAMGVSVIRMFSAPHVRWGGPGSKLSEWMAEFDGTRSAAYWIERNAEELERLLELSKGHDVQYAFELHGGYVVNSASGAMRMLDPYPPTRVGIIMDPGNMVEEGNEGWRNSVEIMGEYLSYIHCKNAAFYREDGEWRVVRTSLEEGIADYPEIMTALKDIGFEGYLSIEDLRREVPPEEKAREGITYLKRLEASTERVMPI